MAEKRAGEKMVENPNACLKKPYIYIESVGMALSEELAQEICPF